jgi:hypothetical protein
MKVSIVSIFLAFLLFTAGSTAQFTKYRAKEYISNAATYAQNNYSPNLIISEITFIRV